MIQTEFEAVFVFERLFNEIQISGLFLLEKDKNAKIDFLII